MSNNKSQGVDPIEAWLAYLTAGGRNQLLREEPGCGGEDAATKLPTREQRARRSIHFVERPVAGTEMG
jgi:hypothetical protein